MTTVMAIAQRQSGHSLQDIFFNMPVVLLFDLENTYYLMEGINVRRWKSGAGVSEMVNLLTQLEADGLR